MLVESILLLFLLASTATASPFQLRESWAEYHDYETGSRHLMVDWQDGRRLSKEINLHLNTDLMKVGYFDNEIWGLMDKKKSGGASRFRVVGWNYRLGIRAISFLDLYYQHTSSHVLDKKPPFKYPVTDSWGVKLWFYRKDKSGPTLWGLF